MKNIALRSLGQSKWLMAMNRYLYLLKDKDMAAMQILKRYQFESTVRFVVLNRGQDQMVGITHENDKIIKFYNADALVEFNGEEGVNLAGLEPRYQ